MSTKMHNICTVILLLSLFRKKLLLLLLLLWWFRLIAACHLEFRFCFRHFLSVFIISINHSTQSRSPCILLSLLSFNIVNCSCCFTIISSFLYLPFFFINILEQGSTQWFLSCLGCCLKLLISFLLLLIIWDKTAKSLLGISFRRND